MGELAEVFNGLKDYRKEQKDSIEPDRIKYATKKLEDIGAKVTPKSDGTRSLLVEYKGLKITFYPYTGWATGKGIKDGRGIHPLINQLKVL